MAGIGLSKPYFAIYSNTGTTVTYSGGSAIGKAVSMDMQLDGADDNVLYADNSAAESENVFSSGKLTLTTDELRPDKMATILGVVGEEITKEGLTTTGAKWYKFNNDQDTPYGGFGAVRKVKLEGAIKWQAIIYTKIQFQNVNDAFSTQGDSIEWQTPELEATLLRDDTTDNEWKRVSSLLDSEADAELLIKDFLNIT